VGIQKRTDVFFERSRAPAGAERGLAPGCAGEPSRSSSADENSRQLHARQAAPFVRDVLRRFRAEKLSRAEVCAELGLGRTRFYELSTAPPSAAGLCNKI